MRHPIPPSKPSGVAIRALDLVEERLIKGWPAAQDVIVRQAAASDLAVVGTLAASAGADLDDDTADAIRAGTCGAAIRAALRSGRDAMVRHLAEQFFIHQFRDQTAPYQHTGLVLVAEHATLGVVGVLLAGPPASVVLELVRHQKDVGESALHLGQQLIAAPMAITQVRAVYVTPTQRGRGIGGALLERCLDIYRHCGFLLIYGNARPAAGPDTLFRRAGFIALAPGDGFDPWVVFGTSVGILPNPGARIFIWPADIRVVPAPVPRSDPGSDVDAVAGAGRGDARAVAYAGLAAVIDQPPEWAPHVAALALWHLHFSGREPSNFEASVTVVEALNMLGVPAEPVPVVVAAKRVAERSGTAPPSLGAHRPMFRSGAYTGYLVVYLPEIGSFIDVSARTDDFSDLVQPLPAPDRLTRQPTKVVRGEYEVGYFPIERRYRNSWSKHHVPAAPLQRQRAALGLASQIVEVLRWNLESQPVDGRYPLLRHILRRVRYAPLVVTGPSGCYFRIADRVEMSVLELRETFAGS